MKIDTTGASEKTAKPNNLTVKGEKNAWLLNSHLTFVWLPIQHYITAYINIDLNML